MEFLFVILFCVIDFIAVVHYICCNFILVGSHTTGLLCSFGIQGNPNSLGYQLSIKSYNNRSMKLDF